MHPVIIFKLYGSVHSFTETSDRRTKFIALLVEKLSLSSFFQPIIVSVSAGSVIVDLVFYQSGSGLSIHDVIQRLKASFKSGDFESIGVIGLTIGDEAILLPETGISLLVIIVVSAISFQIVCILGMLALKKRLDANKVRPFVSGSPIDSADPNNSAAFKVAAISTAAPSNLLMVTAKARASPQDQAPDAVFRRVLPRYDTVPGKSAASSVGSSSSGVPSLVGNKRDAQNSFAAKKN